MKKKYINDMFVIIFLAALCLAACSTTIDTNVNTVETEISESDTLISTAEPAMEVTESEEQLLRKYSSYLLKKAETDDCFHAIGVDTLDDTGLASIIAFCDINFDNVPELFAGYHNMRGYCYYSVYGNEGVIADEISCGMCSKFLRIGNACYSSTHNLANKSHYWLQISDTTLEIAVQDCDDNTTFNVVVTSNDRNDKQNGVTLEEVDKIFFSEFGVTYTELKTAPENYVKSSMGHLTVPDPENYTEEDIYNCLAELLSEYEKISRLEEE